MLSTLAGSTTDLAASSPTTPPAPRAPSTLLTRPPVGPGADVLSASDTLAQALALGLLTADDVLSGRAWVVDSSGSHRVHLVGVGGTATAVVKTPGSVSVLDGDDPVGAERSALRHLAGSGLTPQLLGDDDPPPTGHIWRDTPASLTRCVHSGGGQLWTEAVPGEVLAAQGAASTSTREPFVAWGATLASLHRFPVRGGEPLAPLPWIVAHPTTAPGHLGGREAPVAVREVLAQVQERSALAGALTYVASSWRRTGWCHGDASPTNAIVRSPLSPDDCSVVLVDLEHAGLGDPDWDLATALDGIDTITHDESLAGTRRAQLLAAYRAAGGPGRPDPRHLAARAVLSAVRHASADAERGYDTPCGQAATAALDRAEALASTLPDRVPAASGLVDDLPEEPGEGS